MSNTSFCTVTTTKLKTKAARSRRAGLGCLAVGMTLGAALWAGAAAPRAEAATAALTPIFGVTLA